MKKIEFFKIIIIFFISITFFSLYAREVKVVGILEGESHDRKEFFKKDTSVCSEHEKELYYFIKFVEPDNPVDTIVVITGKQIVDSINFNLKKIYMDSIYNIEIQCPAPYVPTKQVVTTTDGSILWRGSEHTGIYRFCYAKGVVDLYIKVDEE